MEPPLTSTPRLVLDVDRLQSNIDRMAIHVRGLGASFRPHFKTHKTPEIVRRQLEAGAIGVTVATMHEAEVAIGAGVDDVLIAYPPVGAWRLGAIESLLGRARIIVACSEPAHLHMLASLARPVEYYWEVDCGAGRLGATPGDKTADALEVAQVRFPHLKLAGVMTFAGQAYSAATVEERMRVLDQETHALAEMAELLLKRGLDPGVLSAGSTPLAPIQRGVATEYRYGNYVFYDATQVGLGSADLSNCALSVEATVIGRPTDDCVILDSGSKALTAEKMSSVTTTFGLVLGHPELRVEALYEEHAICRSTRPTSLEVGDRVQVVPNHACPCANLHAEYHAQLPGGGETRWEIAARGWG